MVTILDRTGEQQEIEHDKRIWSFGKKATLVLPVEVATWLFRSQNTRYWVHTTEGDYVRRYGVTDAPEDWLTEIGDDVIETSPLTRDTSRAEGWNVDAVRTVPTRVLDLTATANRPQRGDYVNQGAAAPQV